MSDEIRVPVQSDADIILARREARLLAKDLGFSACDLTLIATALSELARNIVDYAGRGEIILSCIEQGGKRGIVLVARDWGPGIPDISLALQDGYSTGKGLGIGLPGTKRLMDEFEIVSAASQGTTVTATKWVR